MAKSTHRAFFDAEKFTERLMEIFDSLPNEIDRQETVSRLEALIEFLNTLKNRIAGIPTQRDASAVRSALIELRAFFAEAKSNPSFAPIIGAKPVSQRSTPAAITPEEIDRANSMISRYQSLPTDELRVALQAENLRGLKAVANAIGVRTATRVTRDALIHQIATKITNTRGYRSLRDGAS
jgi:hypothetical protein